MVLLPVTGTQTEGKRTHMTQTAYARPRVAVLGQGYVGLPVAQAAINAGHTVVGYDTNPHKVAALRVGVSPIEDVTDHDIAAMNATGRYQATDQPNDLADAAIYVVAVPTPLRDGRPDLNDVLAAAITIGPWLRRGDLVILESTVAPGTTRGDFYNTLAAATQLAAEDFLVAFSPERIDPGNPDWRFTNTPKLVGGIDIDSTFAATDFYRSICDQVIRCDSAEIAEAAKLLENTYRYVNIALVNEMGRHLRDLDVDIWDVIDAAATKPYGFQPFWPGPGVGGHCLPVDPMYLSDQVERDLGRCFALLDAAARINAGQPRYVIDRAIRLLNRDGKAVNGSVILVLGAAYKAGTGDVRETPATAIITGLIELGASVAVADPHANLDSIAGVKAVDHLAGATAVAANADLVILLTDHDEFDYEHIGAAARRVLDTRNRFTPASNIHKL